MATLNLKQTILLLSVYGVQQKELDRQSHGYGPEDADDIQWLKGMGLLDALGHVTTLGTTVCKDIIETASAWASVE